MNEKYVNFDHACEFNQTDVLEAETVKNFSILNRLPNRVSGTGYQCRMEHTKVKYT